MSDSPHFPAPPLDIAVLDRYLANCATVEERAVVAQWLGANPAHAEVVAVARTGYQSGALPEVDVEGALARSKQRGEVRVSRVARRGLRNSALLMGTGRALAVRVTGLSSPATWRRAWRWGGISAIGAMIVVFAAGGLGWLHADMTGLPSTREYHTMAGQSATVVFNNGSRAVLGPATTLSVRSERGRQGTMATVSGEVLFIIAQSQTTPFIVNTGNTLTRVLGTTFSVRHYPTDRGAHVTVVSGRVVVQHRDARNGATTETILGARTLGAFGDSTQPVITRNIATEEYTAWTSGRLVFEHVSVQDAMADLGRAYNVDIRVSDSTLAAGLLTWSVPTRTASLSAVLEQLCDLIDVHVVHSGSVFTIVRGRSAARRSSPSHALSTPERRYGL